MMQEPLMRLIIELALRVLGLQPGDKVLTTPLSAFATTLAIVRAGGHPVFVDTDEQGLLDLDLADDALQQDAEIRFMVPVHLYGRCLDMGHLMDIQSRHGIPVIEDCAQALGAAHDGRPAGSVGRVATLSFYPTKNLGALGDGGALVTDDPEVAELAGRLRDYGQSAKFEHVHMGMNSRLDELHAAVLEDVFLPRLAIQGIDAASQDDYLAYILRTSREWRIIRRITVRGKTEA